MDGTDPATRLARDVVFVLVQPQYPGNVGATARAMKNMGLRRLIVVAPPPSFDPERARWMAAGAEDIVDAMRLVATLDEALEGVHRAVATTARHRRDGQTVYEPSELAEQVFAEPDGTVTAILFGREDLGLTREDVSRCESLLRIPTDEHASLNLGQAALLVGHALFASGRAHGLAWTGRKVGGRAGHTTTRALQRGTDDDAPADLPEVEPAVGELIALLSRVGYTRAGGPEKVAVTIREALQRSHLSRKQVRALRGMVGRVQYALEHPEIDWTRTRGSKGGDGPER